MTVHPQESEPKKESQSTQATTTSEASPTVSSQANPNINIHISLGDRPSSSAPVSHSAARGRYSAGLAAAAAEELRHRAPVRVTLPAPASSTGRRYYAVLRPLDDRPPCVAAGQEVCLRLIGGSWVGNGTAPKGFVGLEEAINEVAQKTGQTTVAVVLQ